MLTIIRCCFPNSGSKWRLLLAVPLAKDLNKLGHYYQSIMPKPGNEFSICIKHGIVKFLT